MGTVHVGVIWREHWLGAGNVAKVRTFWSPEGTMIASRVMGKVWGQGKLPWRSCPPFP